MSKKTTVLLALLIGIFTSTFVNATAYIRGASAPWDETTNEEAMDDVFGNNNWDDLRMADGGGPFGDGHDFIFLEGGDGTANELSAYLDANRAAIESYVASGGTLLLNSAPNQGGNIDFGFGGITLFYQNFSANVTAADTGHPVFQGPFTPIATDYTGTFFGHAVVGDSLSPIIVKDPEGDTVLGEMCHGDGLVLFGGMTTDNFHSQQPEAGNLRRNILAYTAEGGNCKVQAIPSTNIWGLLLLAGLLGLTGILTYRRLTFA